MLEASPGLDLVFGEIGTDTGDDAPDASLSGWKNQHHMFDGQVFHGTIVWPSKAMAYRMRNGVRPGATTLATAEGVPILLEDRDYVVQIPWKR